MAIDYDKLLNWPFPDVEHTYAAKDAILYALGLGLGMDPTNEDQLAFLYEDRLRVLPTMCVVLGIPGFWLRNPETGVDWVKILHGEQGLRIDRPLPPQGTVVGRTRVSAIIDKGADKGALIYTERTVIDKATGESLATLTSTTFARGDGGFSGPTRPTPAPHPIPQRKPDSVCDLPTLPQAALIYRLSGDPNPLHADPEVARKAGFEAPILHGLCTLGVAGHAVLKTYCGYDPARFKSLGAPLLRPGLSG